MSSHMEVDNEHGFAPLENDLIIRTAQGQVVERPPIWVMRQAGRYLPEYHEAKGTKDFFECCRDPEVASTLTLQPIERYAGLIDAAIIFSDILVIPQAMGMEVVMVDGKGPVFPNPLTSPEDGRYAELVNNPVDVATELDYVYKAITLTRKKLAGRVPLIGFCGAPWTLFCYMVEGGGARMFKDTKTWIYRYPNEARALLQKIAELCVDHLALQVKAGAQLVQVFDSLAGELSPSAFRKFSAPYLAYIAQEFPARLREMGRDEDDVPMICFPRGAWSSINSVCDMGYHVISLDWLHDPAEAVEAVNDRASIQGNMDPGLLYGSREAITEAVKEMVDGFGWHERQGAWIVNLGHGVTPYVNPDALRFFFEEIHRQTQQRS